METPRPPADAADHGAVFAGAGGGAPGLRNARSDEAIHHWIVHRLLRQTETWVAADGPAILGFASVCDDIATQLWVHPDYYQKAIKAASL